MTARTGSVRLSLLISLITFIIPLTLIFMSCVSPGNNLELKGNKIHEENFEPEINISLGHSITVEALAYSSDGNYLVSCSIDSSVKLWEVSTARVIRTFYGHSSIVNDVKFSPDDRFLVSASDDKTLKIWEVSTGRLVRTLSGHSDEVNSVSFSPDGGYIISGSFDKTIILWDFNTGNQVRTFQGHRGKVSSVAVSPNGKYVVSGSYDKKVIVWNIDTAEIIMTLDDNINPVMAIDISPDGRFIASTIFDFGPSTSESKSSYIFDRSVKVWDLKSGILLHSFENEGSTIASINFSPDSNSLICGTYGLNVLVGDLTTGTLSRSLLSRAHERAMSICVSPDNKTFATGHLSGIIQIWDFKTLEFLVELKSTHNRNHEIFFSPDGKTFATCGFETAVKLWETKTGRLIKTFDYFKHYVRSIAFSPNGKKLAISDSTKNIHLLDIQSGSIINKFYAHRRPVESLTFTPNGEFMVSGARDKTVKIWNTDSGKLYKTLDEHEEWVETVAVSNDGKYVASGFFDSTIIIWDLNSGQKIRTLKGHTSSVQTISFSNDDRFLLSGSSDKTVKVWNIESGSLIKTLTGHEGRISSVNCSPNGAFYATAAWDGSIIIWDSKTFEKIKTLRQQNRMISAISISPDSQYCLSGSWDSTAKLWDIPKGELLYTAYSNEEGEYLVWTPDFYFSGDEILAKEKVIIVKGLQTYPIDQFFDTYYRPDIIQAKIAGKDISKLVGDNSLVDSIVPTPEITIEIERTDGTFRSITSTPINYKITNGKVRVKVSATDQGGGAEEIRLFHNGVRAAGITRGISVESTSDTKTQTFTIQLTDGQNTLRALAFTTNRIESTPSAITISYTAPRKVEPTLWVLAVGINEYKNGRYNLNYAVSDANGFIKAVQKSGKSLFSKIETTLLTDSKATKEGIYTAIEKITARSKPEDVFMFFYAGHGIALQQPETERTEFFFIPTDVTQMTDLAKVMDMGLSGPEFEILVSSIPARKQFLVLDACNSGAINTAFGVRGAAEEIALSRLSRATGSALIAASRDDQFAQEFAALGQGALTKALLDGLGGDAAQTNGQITVGSLKSYVESALPGLTELYAGRAQYPTGFIFGQDFPIGVK